MANNPNVNGLNFGSNVGSSINPSQVFQNQYDTYSRYLPGQQSQMLNPFGFNVDPAGTGRMPVYTPQTAQKPAGVPDGAVNWWLQTDAYGNPTGQWNYSFATEGQGQQQGPQQPQQQIFDGKPYNWNAQSQTWVPVGGGASSPTGDVGHRNQPVQNNGWPSNFLGGIPNGGSQVHNDPGIPGIGKPLNSASSIPYESGEDLFGTNKTYDPVYTGDETTVRYLNGANTPGGNSSVIPGGHGPSNRPPTTGTGSSTYAGEIKAGEKPNQLLSLLSQYFPGIFQTNTAGGTSDPSNQFFTVNPQNSGFTNDFYKWLQTQIGQGTQQFGSNLTAPNNQILQNLFQAFSGGGTTQTPWLNSLFGISDGSTHTQIPDIINQFANNNGLPIDQIPAWQKMVEAMQRNTEQLAAQERGQFAFNGNLNGSPFGQAMTDLYSQTSKDQNALLEQMTTNALEQARGRQLTAGSEILGTNTQDILNRMNSSQFIQGQANNLGTLFQGLDQAGIDRVYNEFLRTRPEYNPLLNLEGQLATTYPPTLRKDNGLGALGAILPSLISLAGQSKKDGGGNNTGGGGNLGGILGPILDKIFKRTPKKNTPEQQKQSKADVNSIITYPEWPDIEKALTGLPLSQWQSYIGQKAPGLASVFNDPNFNWADLLEHVNLSQVDSNIVFGDMADWNLLFDSDNLWDLTYGGGDLTGGGGGDGSWWNGFWDFFGFDFDESAG